MSKRRFASNRAATRWKFMESSVSYKSGATRGISFGGLSRCARKASAGWSLNVRRFGAKTSTLTLRDSGANREALNRITRQIEFREFLRRILTRDFGEWKIEKLLSSADLENSLSPIYTRGVLRRGSQLWAVIRVSRRSDGLREDSDIRVDLARLGTPARRPACRRRPEDLSPLPIHANHGEPAGLPQSRRDTTRALRALTLREA